MFAPKRSSIPQAAATPRSTAEKGGGNLFFPLVNARYENDPDLQSWLCSPPHCSNPPFQLEHRAERGERQRAHGLAVFPPDRSTLSQGPPAPVAISDERLATGDGYRGA